jgi:hypothetical protein
MFHTFHELNSTAAAGRSSADGWFHSRVDERPEITARVAGRVAMERA